MLSARTVKSLTLGTSDGATDGTTSSPQTGTLDSTYDTFIRNVAGTSTFTMTFTGLQIYSVSFDYEIFPDGTCANGSSGNCGTNNSNWPDFTFTAGGTTIFHYYAVMPGTATSTPGTRLSTTSGWTSYTQSPSLTSETAPQLLGTWSGTFTSPVTTLTFADWPATIGIDNLVITTAPEPGAIVLLGTVVVGLFFLQRKGNA